MCVECTNNFSACINVDLLYFNDFVLHASMFILQACKWNTVVFYDLRRCRMNYDESRS